MKYHPTGSGAGLLLRRLGQPQRLAETVRAVVAWVSAIPAVIQSSRLTGCGNVTYTGTAVLDPSRTRAASRSIPRADDSGRSVIRG